MSMRAAYEHPDATVPPPATVLAGEALPPRASASLVLAGLVALVVAAWGGIVPYVGPTFGFGANGDPAWTWDLPHLVLALVPGALGVLAALVVLTQAARLPFGLGRGTVAAAGTMAAVAGAWFAIGPSTRPVWQHAVHPYFLPASPMRSMLDVIGYALGPGIILAAFGGVAVGQALVRRVLPAVDPAGFPIRGRHLRTVPPADAGPGTVVPAAGAAVPAVEPPTAAGVPTVVSPATPAPAPTGAATPTPPPAPEAATPPATPGANTLPPPPPPEATSTP